MHKVNRQFSFSKGPRPSAKDYRTPTLAALPLSSLSRCRRCRCAKTGWDGEFLAFIYILIHPKNGGGGGGGARGGMNEPQKCFFIFTPNSLLSLLLLSVLPSNYTFSLRFFTFLTPFLPLLCFPLNFTPFSFVFSQFITSFLLFSLLFLYGQPIPPNPPRDQQHPRCRRCSYLIG